MVKNIPPVVDNNKKAYNIRVYAQLFLSYRIFCITFIRKTTFFACMRQKNNDFLQNPQKNNPQQENWVYVRRNLSYIKTSFFTSFDVCTKFRLTYIGLQWARFVRCKTNFTHCAYTLLSKSSYFYTNTCKKYMVEIIDLQ